MYQDPAARGGISDQEALTKQVLAYQRDRTGEERLLQSIYLITYNYPQQWHAISEEEASEFLIFFLPTIKGLLRHFTYTGTPFMHYLTSSIRSKIRSYKQYQYKQKSYDIMSIYNFDDRVCHEDSYACFCDEPDSLYRLSGTEKLQGSHTSTGLSSSRQPAIPVPRRPAMNIKQLLYMLLFCCREIPEDLLVKIQEFYAEYEMDYTRMQEQLLRSCEKKQQELTHLQERRNTLFSQVICIETQLKHEVDSDRIAALEEDLKRRQQRLSGVISTIKQFHIHPSHKQIADLLGVPKGSVDSGIFYFKKKYGA